jgi:hypothetical protein
LTPQVDDKIVPGAVPELEGVTGNTGVVLLLTDVDNDTVPVPGKEETPVVKANELLGDVPIDTLLGTAWVLLFHETIG